MSTGPIKLLPCPFCGEHEQIREHIDGTTLHPAYFIKCGSCGATAPWSDKGKEIDEWNTRTP